MSVSRSQWCCLVAALAVVLGLFCGQSAAGRASVVASPMASQAQAQAQAPTAAVAASSDPAPAVAVTEVTVAGGDGVPGCGRGGKREGGEPAVPGRTRAAAQDQAPGLAGWVPVATGPGPVRPPAPAASRGPDVTAPSPVELSVLRV
ncbi:hypothetical protein [Streptomyces sp. NPDC048462]|uniref:hypothetical protein n=1 Tax=Streptomyces sp. NPDC048462 TaxID=3365555 RepID=UPI00371EE8A5